VNVTGRNGFWVGLKGVHSVLGHVLARSSRNETLIPFVRSILLTHASIITYNK
jgi:hypothetical protein